MAGDRVGKYKEEMGGEGGRGGRPRGSRKGDRQRCRRGRG